MMSAPATTRVDVAGERRVAATLEESDARVAVQAGGKADRGRAAVEEVAGERLGDDAPTGGDLVQVEMLQVVGDEGSRWRLSVSWRVGTSVRSTRGPSR
jgi:hypothetical protein